MLVLQIITTIAVLFISAVCAYHLLLAAVALLMPARRSLDLSDTTHTFAIIIPAHNEEDDIEETLLSCRSIDYPHEKFCVYAIADNCKDKTEEFALRSGVRCLVRQDPDNRGKGQALAWAIPQVLDEHWDGIIFLDADCQIDTNALRVFNGHFVAGDRVLQANNSISNPDDSSISYVLAVANKLENVLFDAAKSQLGLACHLRGTGMVLRCDVLREIPWQASSVVEDSEYSFSLTKAAIPVRFVPDVHVVSRCPSNREQLMVQRTRWIAGIRVALPRGLKFLWQGVRDRQVLQIDAGFSVFVAGRFLVMFEWTVSFSLAFCCWFVVPDSFNFTLVLITIFVGCFYVIYTCIGIYMVGLNQRRLALLLRSPLVVLQYLRMAIIAIFHARKTEWRRTPRSKSNL